MADYAGTYPRRCTSHPIWGVRKAPIHAHVNPKPQILCHKCQSAARGRACRRRRRRGGSWEEAAARRGRGRRCRQHTSILRILYFIFYILYSIFYILIFYILYSIFYILYSIFYILYSIFYILYSIFYILYFKSYILYFIFYIYFYSISSIQNNSFPFEVWLYVMQTCLTWEDLYN